jgi:hypothetical protein
VKSLFILFLSLLLLSCNPDKQGKSLAGQEVSEDSVKFTFEANEPITKPYKRLVVNDGYGKREYIDSINFHITRVYFKSDTSRVELETIMDLMNDTTSSVWYHQNGMVKSRSQAIQHFLFPFGTSLSYDTKGNIVEQKDQEEGYQVKLRGALEIALAYGMKPPFQTDLSIDSLRWEIVVWKSLSFDSVTNHGVDIGRGLSIDRKSGEIKEIEKRRDWEI